jgi:hypothetical protein
MHAPLLSQMTKAWEHLRETFMGMIPAYYEPQPLDNLIAAFIALTPDFHTLVTASACLLLL